MASPRTMLRKAIAVRLREARRRRGLTQQEAADALNARFGLKLSQKAISRLETEFTPTLFDARLYAEFYEISLLEFTAMPTVDEYNQWVEEDWLRPPRKPRGSKK
jgi:transcriptional regulator with XRE-family HTH domain